MLKKFEEKTGYDLVIKIFTEFATPNNALAAGEIQANLFQHQPFLDTYNQTNQTDLVAACIMYDCAYGGYTKKTLRRWMRFRKEKPLRSPTMRRI